MRIKSFSSSSGTFPIIEFSESSPLCVLAGTTSSLLLNYIRSFFLPSVVDYPDPDEKTDFMTCAELEADGQDYSVRLKVGSRGSFSISASQNLNGIIKNSTREYFRIIRQICENEGNVFSPERAKTIGGCLSYSDKMLAAFSIFLEELKESTAMGDNRPIFIYHFWSRIDEAVDVSPFIDELLKLNRQIITAVGENHPTESFVREGVQLVRVGIGETAKPDNSVTQTTRHES